MNYLQVVQDLRSPPRLRKAQKLTWPDELDKAVAEIGSDVTGVRTDIAKLDDLDRLYETVAKKGKIDVIFAGGAFVEKTMTAAATLEHFDRPSTPTPAALISPFKRRCLT